MRRGGVSWVYGGGRRGELGLRVCVGGKRVLTGTGGQVHDFHAGVAEREPESGYVEFHVPVSLSTSRWCAVVWCNGNG